MIMTEIYKEVDLLLVQMPFTAVALGLSGAQYVVTTGSITRSTKCNQLRGDLKEIILHNLKFKI
jgi:hypothetical protein